MGDLKPISHKQLNEFMKGKGFKGRNSYKLKELKAKFGFKAMYDRRTLVISSKDMDPTEFNSMRKAAKAIGVGELVIRHARNNERDFLNPIHTGVFWNHILPPNLAWWYSGTKSLKIDNNFDDIITMR